MPAPLPKADIEPRGGLIHVGENGRGVRIDGAPLLGVERLGVGLIKGHMSFHPCIGARALANRGDFYLAIERDLISVASAVRCLQDLEAYLSLTDGGDPIIKTLVLIFVATPSPTQASFEALYWSFAQTLHDIDIAKWAYAPSVSDDPSADNFELSLAGRAIFTTTLNPGSPRFARRFPYPAFVMNQTSQFDALRAEGSFTRWQEAIRRADTDLQGCPNPILQDHGAGSAAGQLPGSAFQPCPFKPRRTHEAKRAALEAVLHRAIEEAAAPAIIDELLIRMQLLAR